MKALSILEPGRTGMVELEPPKPAAGEVLLRVRQVGYCGSDLSTFRGANPLVSYPRIPGHEIAAIVEAVSAGVPASIKPGLRVTVVPYTACGQCSSCRAGRPNACRSNQTLGVQRNGALTEYIAVPWGKLAWSEKLTQEEHALIEPLSVGFHAVARGRVTADDTVLVFGCGMVGLGVIAAAALARRARVIAVDVDDAKLALAARAGARHVIQVQRENLEATVRELTNGEGPSVAIEAAGSAACFRAAVDQVAFAGRVVYIGYAAEPVTYETKHFVLKELDILGSRNATLADFHEVIATLEAGRFPVEQTITRCVPLAEAGEALAGWAASPQRVTKIHVTL